MYTCEDGLQIIPLHQYLGKMSKAFERNNEFDLEIQLIELTEFTLKRYFGPR